MSPKHAGRGRRGRCVRTSLLTLSSASTNSPAIHHSKRLQKPARLVTLTGRPRLARDFARCPCCTASNRRFIITCTCVRVRPTASSLQPVTGRRPSCRQAACYRQLPARPITQADLATLTEKVRRRHLPDRLGQTYGSGGRGGFCCVPGVRWRRPTHRVHYRSGADPEDPESPRRTARASARLSRPGPADRLGRACAGPLSTGQSFRDGETSCPTSTSTASDVIPCHGVDGPREKRFQGGLEPTGKIRP